MKRLLIIMLLLMGTVQGEGLVHLWVNDMNTLNPIEDANATVFNETKAEIIVSEFTDEDGYGDLVTTTQDNYILYISKSGYEVYEESIGITTESNEIVYLRPISTDGIIRLRLVDLTLSNHELCLFFTENGRLHRCHDKHNETLVIHNNMNYTGSLKIHRLDLWSSPTAISNYNYIYIALIMGIFILLSIGVVLYAILKKIK